MEIIGVHTPETPREKVSENVARRTKELGITYPVLIDTPGENWRRWDQRWWPTVYLLDHKGRVRYRWTGELEYRNAGGEAIMTRLIEGLLADAAARDR